ncbi:MAG: 4Fe-4S binding protein [Dehalococcoidia bacterium]|nr:4Fe-4S binding protein [Dehalococcoidia bacterium]MCA9853019.1 4Fe-4S binding protein [Dehalococcoidia bacterium]
MPYVITEPCIGVKDASCVDVCPVDCIHTADEAEMYYIDPDSCIDCSACVNVCPVDAIYSTYDMPAGQERFEEVNAAFFRDRP